MPKPTFVQEKDTIRIVADQKRVDQPHSAILPDSIQAMAGLLRKQLQRGGIDNKTSSILVEVKPGEIGDWLFFYQVGVLGIDGIPPYIGIDPKRFLATANS